MNRSTGSVIVSILKGIRLRGCPVCVAMVAVMGFLVLDLTVPCALPAPLSGEETTASAPFVNLADHGDVSTPEKAQATLDQLAAALRGTNGTGGVIVMDQRVPGPNKFRPVNTYQTSVSQKCNITLLDVRTGTIKVLVPQAGHYQTSAQGWSGMIIERTLDLENGGNIQASQPLAIVNNILRGTYSYCAMPEYGWKPEGVNAKRHYVLNPIGSFTDRKVGWDSEQKQYYVVAGTNESIGLRKNYAPGISVFSYNNADHQTMGSGLDARTYKYGVGDNFVVSALMYYQDNVFSGEGDEGAVILNAETVHDFASFHSKVESFNPETGELVYTPGNFICPDTLALSRPLINLNQAKWLTNGVVRIVPPDTLGDLGGFQEDGKGGYKDWSGSFNVHLKTFYKGKSYPSLEKKDGKYGEIANWLGGLIEASADAPWDESVIGRYFAVDDTAEKYEKGGVGYGSAYMRWPHDKRPVRRWYRICDFKKKEDGTKAIKIVRVRWSAVPAGAPTLINPDNYTWDGHDRPLKYIITPGAEVCDISEAGVLEARNQSGCIFPNTKCKRLIKVVPNDDAKNAFAFAKGDDMEQAVGADPFVPVPVRIRMHDGFPSTMPDPGVQICNDGPIAHQMGLAFQGRAGKSLECMAKRKDGQPSFIDAIDIGTVVGCGMRFRAQVRDAAMIMEQRGDNFQPLTWLHHDSTQAASFGVEPESGNFALKGGGGLDLSSSSLLKAGGLSATEVAARNLRGIALTVPRGSKSLSVKFLQAEADADYAMTVQPNWRTMEWTTAKTPKGFTVEFSEPSPDGATIDWVMVR